MMDVGIAAVILVIMSVAYKTLPYATVQMLCLNKMLKFWPVFMMGFFVRRHGLMAWLAEQRWLYSLSLIGFVVCFLLSDTHYRLVEVPMGICATLFFVLLFRPREQQNSLVETELSRIGRNSLAVYIFQYFFFEIIHLEGLGAWFIASHNYLLDAMCCAVIAVVVAYLCLAVNALLQKSRLAQLCIFGKWAGKIIN